VAKSPDLSENGTELIRTIPAPPTIIPGGMAGNDVLAIVVIRKCDEHMPLHRQHRVYLRELGVDLPVSTLADWVSSVAQALRRLYELILARVLSCYLVQTDSTGMRVLDAGPDHVHRGHFHVYLGRSDVEEGVPHYIALVYTSTGDAEAGPWKTLAGRTGYVLADASNSFDRLFNGKVASAVEVGCNAHARRKLVENELDPRVAYPLQLIRRVYRLETLADEKGLTWQERTQFRQERSKPLMDKLQRYYVKLLASPDATKTDPVCQATHYSINHWTALTRFLDDGRLPLDNNLAEAVFRYLRLGENNFLFAGSDRAAEELAIIHTVLGSARAHGLNQFEYLCDVLDRLSYPMTLDQVAELLPHRWVPRNPPTKPGDVSASAPSS
jgi:transposase